jgi:hypothetical protein
METEMSYSHGGLAIAITNGDLEKADCRDGGPSDGGSSIVD